MHTCTHAMTLDYERDSDQTSRMNDARGKTQSQTIFTFSCLSADNVQREIFQQQLLSLRFFLFLSASPSLYVITFRVIH